MNTSQLVLQLAQTATRRDTWGTIHAIRALITHEEKKKSGGIAEKLRRLLPHPGTDTRPQTAALKYLERITPQKRLEELQLSADIREGCAEVLMEQREAARLAAAGLRPRNRVLLTGPPGNGKTSVAEGIAAALDRPFYGISYDTLIGSHLGETGGRLRQVIDYIGSHECVTLLDEFETIGKERADDDEVGEIKRIVASLLVHLERLPPSTVVIAATNHPDMLDRAAWRRFQIRLRLDAPDRVELGRYLAARLPEIDRRQIHGAATAMRLEKASYAEAAELCDDIERRQVLFGDEDPEHMFRSRHGRWMRQRGDHDREDSEPR